MPKVTNITPEEREQAIYTIGKLGEEITDERIEYYVQLRRNTIEHQEEKVIKEEVNHITEQNKEFARKVLVYMERSKSDRQIFVYSRKHIETLNYIREHNLDIDYTPSLFGEAIRFMEGKKSTTIHHLTAEDIANCIKDKKEKLLNDIKQVETKKKGKSKEKKKVIVNEEEKTIRLTKIAFWLGVILILAPFFITGFGFGWFWYLLIIGVAILCLALMGTDGRNKGDYSFAKSILIGFCIVGCLMYIWGPLNPNYKRGGSRSSSYGYDDTQTKTQWTCCACDKTFTYYKDEIGEHDKWKYWNGKKICYNCYGFRKSVNDALKKNNSPYADYNN